MKKLLLILTLGCFSTVTYSQSATGGIKGGINLGNANIKEARNAWEGEGFTTGVHLGYFLNLSLGGSLHLQPEVYYTFTQAKLSKENVTAPQVPETYTLDFHRLDVPLLIGFRPLPLTRVNFGPFASLLIDTKAETTSPTNQSMEELADELYNRANWGWQIGVGFDLWRFTLDGRYETTIGDLRDQNFDDPSLPAMLPNRQSQRQFVFSLGYKL